MLFLRISWRDLGSLKLTFVELMLRSFILLPSCPPARPAFQASPHFEKIKWGEQAKRVFLGEAPPLNSAFRIWGRLGGG